MKKSVPFLTSMIAIVIIMLSNKSNATPVNKYASNSLDDISSFKNVLIADTIPAKAKGVDGDGNPLPAGTRWDAARKKIIVRRTGKEYVATKDIATNETVKDADKGKANKPKTNGLEGETLKSNTIEVKDIK